MSSVSTNRSPAELRDLAMQAEARARADAAHWQWRPQTLASPWGYEHEFSGDVRTVLERGGCLPRPRPGVAEIPVGHAHARMDAPGGGTMRVCILVDDFDDWVQVETPVGTRHVVARAVIRDIEPAQ